MAELPPPRLRPVPTASRLLLAALLVGLPLAIHAATLGTMLARDQPAPAAAWIALGATSAITVALALVLDWRLRAGRLAWDATGLTLHHALGRRRIEAADVRLDALRHLDLDEHLEWRPRLKLAGIALPGFRGGRWRLRNGRMASVQLAAPGRASVLELRDGHVLLLGLEGAERLRAALEARGAR